MRVADAIGERDVGYEALVANRSTVRPALDFTGGWYAEQRWEGALLTDLLAGAERAASIEVSSLTGYVRRLPVEDAGVLLLARGHTDSRIVRVTHRYLVRPQG